MIEALVSGKLHGQATQKIARSGNPFTTAKVRVPAGDEAIFCNVIAFSDSAQATLLALGDRDAVELARDGKHHRFIQGTRYAHEPRLAG